MDQIELDGVVKEFGATTAVDGVSLTVERGETLAVVGPSGCGKTTLLRTVAGFETPDAGTVRFSGEDVTDTPPERRNVGLVFQSYALFENMSVLRNVTFGPKMHDVGKSERRTRARNLLELLDIAELADRDPATLSGGQQQRVGLARALAIEPRVLLLDEPMTGLDARLKRELRTELAALLDDLDVTTLYVTHDQEEAMTMADRIAIMNEGILQQIAAPHELYEQPANAFVADFLGTSNLLSAQATDGRLDLEFHEVDLNGRSATGPVTVVARPEAFSVGGPIRATITERTYLGGHVRARARLSSGETLTLDLDRAPPVGEEIWLALDAESLHILDETDRTAHDGSRPNTSPEPTTDSPRSD